MKIEEKIQKLFAQVIEKYDGNKKAAADSLGVNTVTFWGWVKSGRGMTMIRPLLNAIERAGGVLLIPGDHPPQASSVSNLDDSDLKKEITRLEEALRRANVDNIRLQAQVDMLKSMFNDAIKNSTLQDNDHATSQKDADKTGKAV